MANRVINAAVSGESIKMSNKVAGAAGSFNAVSLVLTFDSAWDDTTKKIYFFDAYGNNAVYILLTADLLSDGAYIVPIPAEPLVYAGEITITIKGVDFAADGTTAERIIMSASTTMKVLSATLPDSDVVPIEPTPTQAEQLLAALNSVTGMTAAATTLPTGTPATVSKTENVDGTINLNFGVPTGATGAKGDKGEKGDTGEQGLQGTQGPKGDKGDTGLQGEQGEKGEQGVQGEIGDTGPRGEQGIQGIQGEQGEQGLRGPEGPKGPEGDQGIQGPKGDKGDNGDTGNRGNGIASVTLNPDYTLTITYTSGATATTTSIRGATGEKGATGDTGATGNGIASVVLLSGTHAAGTTDTYRITFTDSTAFDFTVYNGANGEGAGDMLASVYDPNGKSADAFNVDNHVSGTTNGVFTTTEKTKLSGIAASANNYAHPTTAGNKHIPTGGASGQILRYSASGTAIWGADNDTITTVNGKTGAITKADITALGIPAQDTVVDISGKADTTYVDGKVKTDVPSGAKFTDTLTLINGKAGAIKKEDIVALGIQAQGADLRLGNFKFVFNEVENSLDFEVLA